MRKSEGGDGLYWREEPHVLVVVRELFEEGILFLHVSASDSERCSRANERGLTMQPSTPIIQNKKII